MKGYAMLLIMDYGLSICGPRRTECSIKWYCPCFLPYIIKWYCCSQNCMSWTFEFFVS